MSHTKIALYVCVPKIQIALNFGFPDNQTDLLFDDPNNPIAFPFYFLDNQITFFSSCP